MSWKEKKSGLSRAEIAAELRALADDLAVGRLRVGAQHVWIGEPLFLGTKQKLKGDTAHFKITVKMPLAYGPAATEGKPPSAAAAELEISPPPRLQGESGYGGRKLKKEIGRLWKSVGNLIEAEKMPDTAETAGLLERCEEFELFADIDWQADWATCTGLVQKCLTDAAIGDWPAAKTTVAEINRMIKECHGRYKK